MLVLPADLYLDAVTFNTWQRGGFLAQILSGLHDDGVAVHIESSVVGEIKNRAGVAGRALIDAVLQRNSIDIVDLRSLDTASWQLVASLARRMTDLEIEAGRRASAPRSANLGEAATLGYILSVDPHGVFVTSDRFAEKVAATAGVSVARTAAFLGVEIELGTLTMNQIWEAVCDSRGCGLDTVVCKDIGECPNLREDAVERGILGKAAKSRLILERTIAGDLMAMQELLNT